MEEKTITPRIHSRATKIGYGVGTMSITVKDVAFTTFVLFYYTSVVGLSGSLAGLVLFINMAWDAATDPVAGAISDNLRSRWGRRIPMMAIGALPLALSFLALFNVPEGLSQMQIFTWMLVSCLLLRTFLTIFAVPYLALGAELSEDYHERSSIAGTRTVIGWAAAMLLTAFAWSVIFQGDGTTDGRLVRDNYYLYGMLSFFVVAAGTLWSIFATAGPAREVPIPPDEGSFSPGALVNDFRVAFRNHNFRYLFLFMLAAGLPTGVVASLATHFNTYFWELTTDQLSLVAILSLVPIAIIALGMGYLNRRFEKHVALRLIVIILALNTLWYAPGRLLGLLPENGTPELFALVVLHTWVLYIMVLWQQTVGSSLIADIADEQELENGRRQEGVFFAAQGFSLKFVSGIGTFMGGVVIDLIRLPLGAEPGTVPDDVLFNFGLVMGPLNLLFLMPPLYFAGKLSMSRAKHGEVLRELARRRSEGSSKSATS